MKKVSYLLLSILAMGCWSCYTAVPIYTKQPVNNQTYYVQYLFEHDGCKVYRFRDDGHYVYFTNCAGNTQSLVEEKNDSVKTSYPIYNQINTENK